MAGWSPLVATAGQEAGLRALSRSDVRGEADRARAMLHRALAEDVLQRASFQQYQYAARDVRSCEDLAPFLPDEAGLETHDAFMARLRREHPRKSGFWSLLGPPGR